MGGDSARIIAHKFVKCEVKPDKSQSTPRLIKANIEREVKPVRKQRLLPNSATVRLKRFHT